MTNSVSGRNNIHTFPAYSARLNRSGPFRTAPNRSEPLRLVIYGEEQKSLHKLTRPVATGRDRPVGGLVMPSVWSRLVSLKVRSEIPRREAIGLEFGFPPQPLTVTVTTAVPFRLGYWSLDRSRPVWNSVSASVSTPWLKVRSEIPRREAIGLEFGFPPQPLTVTVTTAVPFRLGYWSLDRSRPVWNSVSASVSTPWYRGGHTILNDII